MSDGGREVALKAIQQNHDIELRGVRHCINLKSPHLVSIFDVKRNSDGIPFVIMEYVAGPSLRDILRREERGLGMEKAAYLFREIARGLAYLHDRGVVHRDLKPENIFYEDGYAKIGDYGLSKCISISRQSGQTLSVGTVHYMAPEIGSGNYHQGIDIYAFGIILFELLTGNVPFNGDSMGEILMKHLTQEPDVSKLDPHFQPIVRKALAKNPGERFQSAREMVDSVFANEALAAAVARLDGPSFLSTALPAGALQDSPRGVETAPPPPSEPPPQRAPWISPNPEPVAASDTDSLPQSEVQSGWKFFQEQLVPALAATGACAMGLSLFTGRFVLHGVLSNFIILGAASAAILTVEHSFAPRFRLAPGFVRRCATIGIVSPVLVVALGALKLFSAPGMDPTRYAPGLLLGLFAVDWNARARRDRQEQVSVLLALSAGLFGLVVGVMVLTRGAPGGWALLSSFGLLASLSLIVNAASPFTPISKRRRTGSKTPPVSHETPTADAPGPSWKGKALLSRNTFASPPPQWAPPPLRPRTGDSPQRLTRPRRGRVLAGVCAGFAERYGWDPALVRIITVILFLSGFGSPFLVYLACWILIPSERVPAPATMPPSASPHAAPGRRGGLALVTVGSLFLILSGILGLALGLIDSGWASEILKPFVAHERWARLTTTKAENVGLVAVGTFALACLCFLAARLRESASHALRGLVGWSGFGVCFAGLLTETTRATQEWSRGSPASDLSSQIIPFLGFSILGVASLVMLGWPRKRRKSSSNLMAEATGGTIT